MKTKSQYLLDYKNYRARAEQWQKAIQAQLNKSLNIGSRHTLPGGNPHTGQLAHGVTPNDAQVAEYIRSIGGNPYLRKAQEAQEGLRQLKAVKNGAPPAVAKQAAQAVRHSQGIFTKNEQEKAAKQIRAEMKIKKDAAQEQLRTFLEDAQEQYDAANAANEQRYQDVIQGLTESRTRNLERVENYGVAAASDLEERFANTLGDIKANLSARGLGNSTIFDAFRSRNERDLAREQQRLREQVDERIVNYDTQRTNDLMGFMERRTDQGPDFATMASLAMQLGQSGDGEGFDNPVQYQAPEEEGRRAIGAGGKLLAGEKPSLQQPVVEEAAPTVPQPTIAPYQPQPARGIQSRNANQVAAAYQAQVPNFSGFSIFNQGRQQQYAPQQQQPVPQYQGDPTIPPWVARVQQVDPAAERLAYTRLKQKNRAARLAELKAGTADARKRNLAAQERRAARELQEDIDHFANQPGF